MDANAPNQERQHWVPLPYGETTHLVFLAQNEAVNAVAHQQGNNCQAAADQRSSIGSTGLRQNLGGVSRGSGSLDNLLLVRSSGGLIAGIALMKSPVEDNQKFGKLITIISAVMLGLSLICCIIGGLSGLAAVPYSVSYNF